MADRPKFWFQNDNSKTPLQNAMERIKAAYIAAFISAGITLVFAVLSAGGVDIVNGINFYAIIDVVLLIFLAVLIMTIKSRSASIILFIYFLASKVFLFMENPESMVSSWYISLIFLIAYFCGVLGTFSYHKIKKRESVEPIDE